MNASDTAIIDSLAVDGGVAEAVDRYVGPCLDGPMAARCPLIFSDTAAEGDVAACVSDCPSSTPVPGLSDPCMLCYAEMTYGVTDNCLLPCLGGDAVACTSCFEVACTPRLRECTGIP